MKKNWIFLTILILFSAVVSITAAEGKLLEGKKTKRTIQPGKDKVIHPCLTPPASELITLPLSRKSPWSLPDKSLAANFERTVNILVLRFNFQYETEDDESTTGRGHMDLSTDSAAFFDSNGHYIDPPPHDSLYFDAHLQALNNYYEQVTEDGLHLTWDIFPSGKDSVYQLPHQMNYYGACIDEIEGFDSIIIGLERYFVDCIRLVDSTSPEVIFSNYESVFLIHPGSDQQNNIGFPNTCRDLFSGYIKFGDSIVADDGTVFVSGIPVDDGADSIRTALMLPEAVSQDNRATALNAVLAHEFGHQLGLVDMYRTGSFRTQLGDFALMDNNGFGTGVDFGFPVGSVFGINPLYPCAWSRAYLGFEEVYDFRQGDDIRLAAAEVISDGIQIARVPISEDEYYLIENRVAETDGELTYIFADSQTNVIIGPCNANKELTGEYDHLIPGSGLIIYHVDESVAAGDFNNNGVNNFYDNQLQLDPLKRFIRIVEADGIVDFGGYYNAGFGSEEDLFREDRNNSFTPNTNPPSFDNTGNNTHVSITNIRRDTILVGESLQPIDTVMKFDLETTGLKNNFPIRCGYRFLSGVLEDQSTGQPVLAKFNTLNSIADDINRDGVDEIITASNYKVLVFTPNGQNFMQQFTNCDPCQIYYDNAISRYDGGVHFTSGDNHARENEHEIPLYFDPLGFITAGPVTGDFGETDSMKLVSVGVLLDLETGKVVVNALQDNDNDTQADNFFAFSTVGLPIAMSFGDILYVVTDKGAVYIKDGFNSDDALAYQLEVDSIYGICRNNDDLIVTAKKDNNTEIYYYDYSEDTFIEAFVVNNIYDFSPVIVDLDRDDTNNLILASSDGKISVISIDESEIITADPEQIFSITVSESFAEEYTTSPVIGDIDRNGYPDIIIGGKGLLYAYDKFLQLLPDYPIEINDRFSDEYTFAPPVIAKLENSNDVEVIVPTSIGNVYSFSPDISYGFPLSAGERSNGSPLVINTTEGPALGFVGDDGWFYLWDFWAGEFDEQNAFWPMVGADPSGSNAFDMSKLTDPTHASSLIPENDYYCYPNPVTTGVANIRYTLGEIADNVNLTIYDLSGEEIVSLEGSSNEGLNELQWTCNNVSPGVYRCVIEAVFNNQSENAFTDIAVIR